MDPKRPSHSRLASIPRSCFWRAAYRWALVFPNFLRVKTEDANCFCSPDIIYDIFILSIVLRSREPLFTMEDSDTNDYVHNRRSRTISNLSQQQLQHKRDLDRKAQRALRQRTKSRIQELSDDIARLKASSSERETAMIDELQALREQNRQLKMRLEHISRLAANHDSSENGTEICTDEHSNEKEVEGGGLITSSRGNRPSEEDDGQPSSDFDATVEDVDNGTYVYKPGDVNLQVPQYPQEADQSHLHDIGSSPYKEVMLTSYAPASHMELVYAVVEENGESRNSVGTAPSECVENTSIQQIEKGMVIPTLDCVSRQAHMEQINTLMAHDPLREMSPKHRQSHQRAPQPPTQRIFLTAVTALGACLRFCLDICQQLVH